MIVRFSSERCLPRKCLFLFTGVYFSLRSTNGMTSPDKAIRLDLQSGAGWTLRKRLVEENRFHRILDHGVPTRDELGEADCVFPESLCAGIKTQPTTAIYSAWKLKAGHTRAGRVLTNSSQNVVQIEKTRQLNTPPPKYTELLPESENSKQARAEYPRAQKPRRRKAAIKR